jgi:hypothetical protein
VGFKAGFEKVAGLGTAFKAGATVVKPVASLAFKGANKVFGGGIGTFLTGVEAVNNFKKYDNQMQAAVSR